MKDLGELTWCLGIRIVRDKPTRSILMSQDSYATRVLERMKMTDSKPVSTPLAPGTILTADPQPGDKEHEKEMKSVPYREAIGCLMYLMVCTRPDLADAVSAVSRYAANPHWHHWVAVKHILRYLNGTKNLALQLGRMEITNVHGYSDSDYAADRATRRLQTGYLFQIGSSTITWNSKRQTTVALSSCEAEYMALCQAAREAMWLRELLCEIGRPQKAITIHEDNQGAIAVSKNPEHHSRMKHVDVRYHYVRERVNDGSIKIDYLQTSKMVADALTKPLPREKFQWCRDAMGLVPVNPKKLKDSKK